MNMRFVHFASVAVLACLILAGGAPAHGNTGNYDSNGQGTPSISTPGTDGPTPNYQSNSCPLVNGVPSCECNVANTSCYSSTETLGGTPYYAPPATVSSGLTSNWPYVGAQSPAGSSAAGALNVWNRCYYVDNSTSGKPIFVPFNTSGEWTAFLGNVMTPGSPNSFISLTGCALPYPVSVATYTVPAPSYGGGCTGTPAVSTPIIYNRAGATWLSPNSPSSVVFSCYGGATTIQSSVTWTGYDSNQCASVGNISSACPNYPYSWNPIPSYSPDLRLTASPSSITSGDPTVLTWALPNGGALSCTASSSDNSWAATISATGGSVTLTPNPTAPATSTIYTVQCTGKKGLISTATITIEVAVPDPTVTLTATDTSSGAPSPSSVTATDNSQNLTINSGDSVTLSWNSTNATSCTGSGDTGFIDAVANTTSSSVDGPYSTTPSAKTFGISCTNSAGYTAQASVAIVFNTSVTSGNCYTLVAAPIANGIYGTGSANSPADNGGSPCTNSVIETYEGINGCSKDQGTINDVNYTCQSAGYAGPAMSNGGNVFAYIGPLYSGGGEGVYNYTLSKVYPTGCSPYAPSGPFSTTSYGAFYECEQQSQMHPILDVWCTNSPSTCQLPPYACPATVISGTSLPNGQVGDSKTVGKCNAAGGVIYSCGITGWSGTDCGGGGDQ